MPNSSSGHEELRQEWREEPPDISYRFVVSLGTLRSAYSVLEAVRKKKIALWKRALIFTISLILKLIGSVLLVALAAWPAFELARLVDREFSADMPFLTAISFLVVFLAIFSASCVGLRRLGKLPSQQLYREYFADNVFLMEARKSHVWFDERSAGAIRRWSTFEQFVEFDEGMWLVLRRRTTFAGLR